MGFLSTVCSVVSSVCSAIGSAISSVASSVSSAVSAFMGAVGTLANKLGPVLGKVGNIIGIIVTVVEIAARLANLLQPQETVREIGKRALQAEDEDITLETCDNDFKAYMEKLRALKLDPEKNARHSDWEQQAAGIVVLEKGLEQCEPCLTSRAMWEVMCRYPEFFSKERLKCYAEFARESGLPLGDSVACWGTSEGSSLERLKALDFMEGAEQRFQPEASPGDITRTLRDAEKKISQPS
ncbi:hypothetical protein [uncultured Desulfovibrio sp.]|uniref:hypothetical protein n=1 Tax=uncultured Desulfovibrio sp. TaxID=167968 RepID=UPI00261B24EE|nr:hypothetical protein [uncultured Desulfovibrio sp.]